MGLLKKKKDALKYTETPEILAGVPTDGNPGGIPPPPFAEPTIPEPPAPPPMSEPAPPPGKRPLTDLEVNGYFGSSVIVLLQQLTELQRQTLEVLTAMAEEEEESES